MPDSVKPQGPGFRPTVEVVGADPTAPDQDVPKGEKPQAGPRMAPSRVLSLIEAITKSGAPANVGNLFKGPDVTRKAADKMLAAFMDLLTQRNIRPPF